MRDLGLYVKQDGMYNTLEIVLSDIPIEDVKDWHRLTIDEGVSSFKDLLWKCRTYFMANSGDSVDSIRLIDSKISDEIKITKEEIEDMNVFRMI